MKKTLQILYSNIALILSIWMLLILLPAKVTAQHSHSFHAVLDSYHKGEIEIDEAIQLQIESLEQTDDHSFVKCLTPLLILVENNADDLSPETRLKLNSFFNDTLQQSAPLRFRSNTGKFRIHYEIAGADRVPSDDFNNNGTPDYVEAVAEAADSSYRHEIVTLGFRDPIGPGEIYDIYLEDLSNFGAYGLTSNLSGGTFSCPSGSGSPDTCIYMENDFDGYPENTDPEGDVLGAVKVTVAHEFKHAIQFAQNNWNGDSDRWAEMDATLMEEVVYDTVNDYYNYIEGFSSDLFSSPSTSLVAGSYEDITWALFYHEKFGPTFWTDVWVKVEENSSLLFSEAIGLTLQDMEESINGTFVESYAWHFASGDNFSVPGFGFSDCSSL